MKNKYIELAIEIAQIGAFNDEIPVGAVVVYKDEVIAVAYNEKEKEKCSIKHAEILAIEEASKKMNDWRLNDCDMYLTMEPCLMCCGALIQARIRNVYYILENKKFGGISFINKLSREARYNHCVNYIKVNDERYETKMEKMLKNFFIDKR